MRRFRLTLLFVITALLVIVLAAVTVNRVIGDLAKENLIRTAEENTVRDALHMQSMMRRGHSMDGMPSASDGSMGNIQAATALSLEFLTGPEGLSRSFPSLVEGLSIVKLNLFDLNGTTVWSTDRQTVGITKRESPLYREAVRGEYSSKLVQDHEVVHLDGVTRRIDVVETYLPLRETREGNIIGVMEVYRDIANDVAVQVDDARRTVLRVTIATMGGLFLVLSGFIVVADVAIYRGNRREVSLVQVQLAERKAAQKALQKSEEEAQQLATENAVIAQIGRIITASFEVEQVFQRFAGEVRKLIPFDRIVITSLDSERATATASYIEGTEIPGWSSVETHPIAGTLTEAVVSARSGLIMRDEPAEGFAAHYPIEARARAVGLRSMIAVPLISNDLAIGALVLRSKMPGTYSPEHLALAHRIATQIAGALANSQLYHQRQRAQEQLREAKEAAVAATRAKK